MIYNDHGAPTRDGLEQPHGADAFLWAHAGQGFVEQQQRRRRRQRQPDFKPALFAVCEVGHGRVGALDEIDQFERMLDPPFELRNALRGPEQVQPEGTAQLRQDADCQIFANRQAIEELVDLITLGEAKLAHLGNRHAGDVVPFE